MKTTELNGRHYTATSKKMSLDDAILQDLDTECARKSYFHFTRHLSDQRDLSSFDMTNPSLDIIKRICESCIKTDVLNVTEIFTWLEQHGYIEEAETETEKTYVSGDQFIYNDNYTSPENLLTFTILEYKAEYALGWVGKGGNIRTASGFSKVKDEHKIKLSELTAYPESYEKT